ncbi:hypothetical protein T4A_6802 [Trichinella pseudospiralis]|uniref:Uncharacterized protein n=1 Tax=Trichinella pseudospiralis TaxID=6337 RepID=A0A0V1EQB6_TRIPS|nr:hypothetical protein T4A_6802 [Trichinella pseudospiralis]
MKEKHFFVSQITKLKLAEVFVNPSLKRSEMKKFHFFANCIGPDECMKSLQWIATIESNHKQN